MTVKPQFLTALQQIDVAWVEQVLACAGYSGVLVRNIEMAPIGAGNVSDTVRVRINHDGNIAGVPGSVICKFSAGDPLAHAHGIGSGSYGREVESYRSLSRADAVCRIPRLYWVDGSNEGINLVIEDLTDCTRAGNQLTGCSVREGFAVVEELARLHRRFYPMNGTERPEWALVMADVADYWDDAIRRAMPIIADNDFGRIKPHEWDILRTVERKARAWFEMPLERATLTHGDPRVDNILFEDREKGVSAITIDWQMTGCRNPMHDVGYFLSGSVSVEDRRTHERAMLEHYLSSFGTENDYDLATIEQDYRVQLLSGLMTTVGAYSVLPMTESVDLLLITLLKRNLAAAADWDSLSAF
ncbi:MAG: phosphotransferase [Caenibius sp.]